MTLKQEKLSQSDPDLIRQFWKKLQSNPVLIRPKLASVLIPSDPVLIRAHLWYPAEVSMDRIKIGYPAGYLWVFRIRIGFGYSFLNKNWIRTGWGYWFDFYKEIFLRVIQDVTDLVAVFSSLWFLYCQYVLHSSQSMVIRVTLLLIFSGQVEVVSCSYIAGMLLCLLCWMANVCVL